jgi:hypothetical protein
VYIFKVRIIHFPQYGGELERAAMNFTKEGFLGNVYSDISGKSAHSAPLYPSLLAGIYYIFGWDTISGLIIQRLLITTITVISIGFLVIVAQKAKLSPSSGLFTGLCIALLPINFWTDTTGGEQSYTALFLLILFWLFCDLHEIQWNSWKRVIITGIILGISLLLSPALAPSGILMFFSELAFQRGNRKRILLSGILIGMVSLVIVTPWIIRNYYALGGFVPIRSNFGLEFAIGNNPKTVDGGFSVKNINEILSAIHPYLNRKECMKLMQLGEIAYMKQKQQETFKWIQDNPKSFIKLTLKRFWFFWFPSENMWASDGTANISKSLIFCLISLGMFCGIWRLGLIGHPSIRLFTSAIFGFSLSYMITHISLRYRYPVSGLSMLLACDFAIALYYKIRLKFSRSEVRMESRTNS